MQQVYKQYELQKAINDAVLEVYNKDPSLFEGDEEKAITAIEDTLANTSIEYRLLKSKVVVDPTTNQQRIITTEVKNVLGVLYSEKKVNVRSPLYRMIDYTILPKKAINHNPNKNKFIEAVSHLYWNTDAYSVGTTLTALRRFCENIHFNLGTKGARKQDTCLYQYSAVQGGTGKSVLCKHWVNTLKNLGYQAGPVTINERWIGSEFSKYIVSYQDEFFPPTKANREGILTKLNPIICDDYYQVECKFQDAYQVRSQTSMILNSNYLPFDSNTSRYWNITFYNIDFRKDHNKSRIRTQEEDYEKWMLQALETVPFGEYWENPIKTTKASVDEIVWKARAVLEDIACSSSFTATSATIREFVNAYIKATDSNVLPKSLQNEVYQAIIEGDIEPVLRVNGNLRYSKYNWEEIADMETSETSKSNASLDNVSDPLDRTEVAFSLYLDSTDNNPTDNNPTDNNPTDNNPTDNNPTDNNPTDNNPTDEEIAADEILEEVTDNNPTDEDMIEQAALECAMIDEPMIEEEPKVTEPVVEEPKVEEPVFEEEPITEEPKVMVETPKAVEPKAARIKTISDYMCEDVFKDMLADIDKTLGTKKESKAEEPKATEPMIKEEPKAMVETPKAMVETPKAMVETPKATEPMIKEEPKAMVETPKAVEPMTKMEKLESTVKMEKLESTGFTLKPNRDDCAASLELQRGATEILCNMCGITISTPALGTITPNSIVKEEPKAMVETLKAEETPKEDPAIYEHTTEEPPKEEPEAKESETKEPIAKESTHEYPEGFDMNQRVFTTEDAYHFGVSALNDKFDKEMHNDVSGKEEFICASTYKENGLEITEGKLIRKTEAMLPVFFVYESDDLPLREQGAKLADILNHTPYRKNIFSVTYSGSKSIHTLVYIDPKDRENVARDFKFYWSQVGLKIFGSDYHKHLDEACASIVRLTRMPGGYRKDKGKVQFCNLLNRAVEGVDVSYVNELYDAKVEEERKQKEEEEKKRQELIEICKVNGVTVSKFANPDSEIHLRRAVMKSNNPSGQIAVDLLDGKDPGSGANYIGAIGYAEKVCGKETAATIRSLAHALHPSNIKTKATA